MRRTARLALGAVVLLAASAAMAQNAATTDLYPLKKDTKWVYKVGETSITVRVASADAAGATLETLVNDKVVATETLEVKADGVYRTQINKAKIEPPVKILQLKAGKADGRAVAQILGYMGDLKSEEPDRKVRGILVAHEFDQRSRSAASILPDLQLTTYSIEFRFVAERS